VRMIVRLESPNGRVRSEPDDGVMHSHS